MAGRLFELHRDRDVSGVTGTGVVADGAEFPDGTVVVRWRGEHTSTVVWPSLDDALAIHGHDGATRVVWDPPPRVGRVTVEVDSQRVTQVARAAVDDALAEVARDIAAERGPRR